MLHALQTGSGKTYTMLGDLGSATDRGLAPRLCEDLFQRIETAQSSGDVNFDRASDSWLKAMNPNTAPKSGAKIMVSS